MTLRLIETVTQEPGRTDRTAKVYRDTVWQEYVVRFSEAHVMLPNADYHTCDKQDAATTARAWVDAK